ncbi:hypothetical protein P171DRAFT_471114 [Karstenula rhodostoma CBS 690.94]|uniref:Uncharacterized protein n=1 Tax=Karstenula rhodostoma CBS 690.94 TaxID=1392251 RepID=A0A9P4UG76_9PLEO|nr:hypothetical protein P171DRAFT_471114 [Karstenula rhodostoma CBS 690.94]
MLLKKLFFLGLAVLSAASPDLGHLETRAKTGTAVGTKAGSKGKSGGATCPNNNAITGATCPGAKFTAVEIEKAVKQAKAMKVKGKTGKGLHFPAKYKPSQETKAKGVKKAKGSKAGKTVKREEHALQARRARGGRTRTGTRPKTTRPKKTPKKTTPKKTPKKTPKTTPKKTTHKTTKKNCKAGGKAAKVGKGVWMFPILDKGVWKPGVFPDVSYIILDSKFNYVKTTERKPGSAEEYQICAGNPQSKKGGKTKDSANSFENIETLKETPGNTVDVPGGLLLWFTANCKETWRVYAGTFYEDDGRANYIRG